MPQLFGTREWICGFRDIQPHGRAGGEGGPADFLLRPQAGESAPAQGLARTLETHTVAF